MSYKNRRYLLDIVIYLQYGAPYGSDVDKRIENLLIQKEPLTCTCI